MSSSSFSLADLSVPPILKCKIQNVRVQQHNHSNTVEKTYIVVMQIVIIRVENYTTFPPEWLQMELRRRSYTQWPPPDRLDSWLMQ